MSRVSEEIVSATPPPVVRGIEICDAQAFEFGGLVANSLYDFRSDKRLVIFDLSDAIMRHL